MIIRINSLGGLTGFTALQKVELHYMNNIMQAAENKFQSTIYYFVFRISLLICFFSIFLTSNNEKQIAGINNLQGSNLRQRRQKKWS